MTLDLQNKNVLVVGLGSRGRAACELAARSGAHVTGIDSGDTSELKSGIEKLKSAGVETSLGARSIPSQEFDLAILSGAIPENQTLIEALGKRKVATVGELEFGFQRAQCLSIAIAGTNGKGTTAEMVERMLTGNERKAILAGHQANPVCSVVEQSRELDFLVLQVNALQLETTTTFHPSVAVLMNLAPEYLDHYATADDYVKANARLFQNQQNFDWAIIQSEALAQMKKLNLPIPAKTITFSANDSSADIYLDRGLIISRIPNWPGPLLNMEHCQVRGPHNAENVMAALAVGHALRLPLEAMVESLKTYVAGPHRFEFVAEINGVQYINDSKATNADALHKALLGTRTGIDGSANVWLIAGGRDQDVEFHDLGPVLSRRVKQALLVGQASEKIHAAWGLFTPCKVAGTLLEALSEATQNATSGDVVLLSPACSSFDQFRNYQHRGEEFCSAVKSISRGA